MLFDWEGQEVMQGTEHEVYTRRGLDPAPQCLAVRKSNVWDSVSIS